MNVHHHRSLLTSDDPKASGQPAGGKATPPVGSPSAGTSYPSRRRTDVSCDNCGAYEGVACQPFCIGEQYS